MKNRSFPWAIIAAAAVAGAGFAGVASYVSGKGNNPAAVQNQIDEPGVVVKTNQPDQGDGSNKSTDATNQEATIKVSKVDTLNKALKDKRYGEFRVLDISVDNGNAMIDMNKELLKGMGSEAEADFIDIIKTTMAQFSDVKTFQIRIDGEIQKSLSHFEMIDPVPVR